MAHLPPVGWADVATKQDLAVVSGKIDALREATSKDLEALRFATKVDLERGLRRQTVWMASVSSMQSGLVIWLVERLAS